MESWILPVTTKECSKMRKVQTGYDDVRVFTFNVILIYNSVLNIIPCGGLEIEAIY